MFYYIFVTSIKNTKNLLLLFDLKVRGTRHPLVIATVEG